MHASAFTIIGHRGAAGTAPENTLASIQAALSTGIPYVEVDIQRSKDGVLVLMHDRKVNRTTNGRGAVADLDWSSLQALDAGSKFSIRYAGERIPSLESALQLVRQAKAILIIEVKNPARYPGLAIALDTLIRAQSASQHALVMSFDIGFMAELAHLQPNYPLGCLYVFPPRPGAPELSFARFVSVNWRSVWFFSKRLQLLRAQGITVWAWTVNHPKRIKKMHRAGFSGVVTDFPGIILKWL